MNTMMFCSAPRNRSEDVEAGHCLLPAGFRISEMVCVRRFASDHPLRAGYAALTERSRPRATPVSHRPFPWPFLPFPTGSIPDRGLGGAGHTTGFLSHLRAAGKKVLVHSAHSPFAGAAQPVSKRGTAGTGHAFLSPSPRFLLDGENNRFQ